MYKYLSGFDSIDSRTGGLNPGTTIMVIAPPFTDGDLIAAAIAKPRTHEYTITLTTEIDSGSLLDYYGTCGGGIETSHIAFIDSSGHAKGEDEGQVRFVQSPSDLTGMDIKFTGLVEEIMKGNFADDPNHMFPTPIRYCLLSITTLLLFRPLDTVYQFLHVISGKLKKFGSIGIFLLNAESFDPKTVSVLTQLMTLVIEVRSGENGNEITIKGGMGLSMPWKPFTIENGDIVLLK
jgi:hypothetical protein